MLTATASLHVPRILLLSPQGCHGRRRRMLMLRKDTAPDVGQDKAILGINHLRQPSQRPCTAAHTSAILALGYEVEESPKTLQVDLCLGVGRGTLRMCEVPMRDSHLKTSLFRSLIGS
jgi:hypothetical protein